MINILLREVVMIIYGFPSKKHALQFEWAWQKPLQSRHTKITTKQNEKELNRVSSQAKKYSNYMLTKMWAAQLLLNTKPFSMLPLKLRFVLQNIQALFYENVSLPNHITYSIGTIQDLMKDIKEKGKSDLIRPSLPSSLHRQGDNCRFSPRNYTYLLYL